MAFTHTTLNNFASTLSSLIAQRAVGLDDASERIVELRPAEQILAGFLTPMNDEEAKDTRDADIDEQLYEDLPQDSPYEQTSVGFEWLAPQQALQKCATMTLVIDCAVYIRRLPTYQEQSKYGTPKTEKPKVSSVSKGVADATVQGQAVRYEDLVMVWTREKLADPLSVEINLDQLIKERVLRMNLGDDLQKRLVIGRDLAPKRPVRVPIEALKDEHTFLQWLGNLPQRPLDRFWQPVVDVRLSSVPTEPDCVYTLNLKGF